MIILKNCFYEEEIKNWCEIILNMYFVNYVVIGMLR